MKLMVITEKASPHINMSVSSLSTLQKEVNINLEEQKPNSVNRSRDMASLSGSVTSLKAANHELLSKTNENLLLDNANHKLPSKTESDSNLENAMQCSFDSNSTNLSIKQDVSTVQVPQNTGMSQKKIVGGENPSRNIVSTMDVTSRELGSLQRSNSDISLHRFRVATEDSDSVKSIKSSPFQPKPPIIPRKSRPLPLSHRTTKATPDPDSLEKENADCVDDQKSFPDQVSSNDNYHKPQLSSSQMELITAQRSSSSFDGYPFNSDHCLADQIGSTLSVRSLPTPTLPCLTPVTSLSSLPPFNENFSCKTLRTAYKSEPLFNTHQINGGSLLGTFSHSSFALSSISALPAITTKEARSRSYLFGNINSGISLLGSEELQRYFPDRKVKLFTGTWNMEGCKDMSSQQILDFILPEICDLVQDIYVIGTQENSMQKKEWEIILQENLGPSYVLFHSVSLGSLHLAVFMRRDLIWFCSNLEESNLATRAVTMIKTKGSVALAFSFFGTSMLFINSHFTACYDKISNRMNDYEKTIRELRLAKRKQTSPSKDAIGRYDSVFWTGDFNFRIDGDACPVEDMLGDQNPNFEKILRSDQLQQLINEDKIFKGFQEGRIIFPPTYKFVIKSEKNVYSKLRTPSYTDRILFRSKRKNYVTCINYNCALKVKVSDHKPVFGIYEVALRPGRDTLTLDAGRFNKEVYIEANKRRAQSQGSKQVNQKSSSVCNIQ